MADRENAQMVNGPDDQLARVRMLHMWYIYFWDTVSFDDLKWRVLQEPGTTANDTNCDSVNVAKVLAGINKLDTINRPWAAFEANATDLKTK